MEQDQASKPLHRSPQGKNRRAAGAQKASPKVPIRQRNRRRLEHHTPTRDTRLSPSNPSLRPGARHGEGAPKSPNQPNARFLGWWFPLISSVSWRVVLRSWNVLIVKLCAPWNHMVGSYGSSLTTNVKRLLPIPDNDGPGLIRTGIKPHHDLVDLSDSYLLDENGNTDHSS